MIRSGTTTYADMYYFEDEVARAARKARGSNSSPGARTPACRGAGRRRPRPEGAGRHGHDVAAPARDRVRVDIGRSLALPGRIGGGALPRVRLFDMKLLPLSKGVTTALTQPLITALRERLAQVRLDSHRHAEL